MKKFYFLFSALFITSLTFGQVIVSDDFDAYADGSLTAQSAWTTHSGVAGNLLVSSGQVIVQHGVPDEDATLPFTSVTGVIYYGLDFSVSSTGQITGGDYEYFAHFKDDGFGFRGRLDIVDAPSGGDFSLGISSSTSTAQGLWPNDLTFGQTYHIVVKFDQDAGLATLWVDPDPTDEAGSTNVSGTVDGGGVIMTGFALRQSDSSLNETVTVDNVVVGTTFALSTKENQINGFDLYPNPTKEAFVTITSDKHTPMKVSVYDILGKQVLEQTVTNNRLNISNLNTGVYILRAEQDNAFTTRKLVIN